MTPLAVLASLPVGATVTTALSPVVRLRKKHEKARRKDDLPTPGPPVTNVLCARLHNLP